MNSLSRLHLDVYIGQFTLCKRHSISLPMGATREAHHPASYLQTTHVKGYASFSLRSSCTHSSARLHPLWGPMGGAQGRNEQAKIWQLWCHPFNPSGTCPLDIAIFVYQELYIYRSSGSERPVEWALQSRSGCCRSAEVALLTALRTRDAGALVWNSSGLDMSK